MLIDFQIYQENCVWRQKESFPFHCFLGHNISHLIFLPNIDSCWSDHHSHTQACCIQLILLHAAENSRGLTLHPLTAFLYLLKTCAQMVASHSLSEAALSLSWAKIKYFYLDQLWREMATCFDD